MLMADEWGVLGTWAGAVATFWAVWVALFQNKPKVRIISRVLDNESIIDADIKNKIVFIVINKGNTPLKITHVGLKAPKSYIMLTRVIDGELPIMLDPKDQFMVLLDPKKLSELPGKRKRIDVACVWDSLGNIYYHEVGLLDRITRRLWWIFGKE